MKQYFKVFLFLILQVLLFNSLFATDLYWIGGNGVWNNPNNWSLTSGGSASNIIPTATDHVFFDNNSSNGNYVVEINSAAEVGNFEVLGNHGITLRGISSSPLSFHGDILWNQKIVNEFKGEFNLNSTSGQVNKVDFSNQLIHGDLNVSGNGTIEFINEFWIKAKFNFISGSISILNAFVAADGFTTSGNNVKNLSLQNAVFIVDQTFTSIPPALQLTVPSNSYTNLNPNLKPKISGSMIQKLIVGFTVAQNNVSCHGLNDGKAWVTSITTTGSTGPFAYQWRRFSNNAIVSTTDTAFNLSGGLYSLRITDLSDNTFSQQFVSIVEPSEIGTLIFATDETCINSCDGVINVSTTGGTPPYNFNWSSGHPTSTAFGLCDGTYTLTITDANGCIRLDTATVGEPSLILPNVSTTNVDCFGNCNGTATANPTGGSGTYVNYEWSTSQAGPTLNSINSLCAGTYFVTVTDSDGCTNSDTFNITEPSAPLSVNKSFTNAICFGTATGTITINPSGGTSPYTYLWNDSPITKDRTAIAAGNYTVTVTDNNGCTVTNSTTITEPTDISISFTSIVNVDCNGDTTGSATASPSGGTPPYTGFAWSNNDATPTANNLAAGFHRVTVTDNNGCTKVDSVEITEPTPVQITVDNQTDPLCNGDANGIINTTPSGGVGPYTYAWSDGPSSAEDRNNLTARSYTISVTDANGCLTTTNVVLNDPPLLTVIIDSLENVSCNSGSDGFARALATGGTGALTYNWSNKGIGPRSNPNLSAGTYTVTVTDANNCTATAVANITQPTTALSVSITKTDASCNGQSDGTATANGSGGTPPYSYNWGANGTTQTITGLSVGNYTVTITDLNGCTAQATTTIAQPTSINVSIAPQNLRCNGDNSGEAEALPTGGTPPYTYQWNDLNNQITKTAINLSAGSYTVTVTDDNGCTGTANTTLTEPPVLTASISSSTPPSCNGGSNGTATTSATGGTSPYTYQWSDANNQTTQTANNLTAGTYFVTITDDSSCTAVASVNITQPAAITMNFNPQNVSCFGGNDGAVTVSNVSGGQPPYTFLWSNGPPSASVSGLTAGIYTLTVTDANGCTAVRVANITEPASALAVTVNGTNVLCNGDTTGTVNTVVTGGTTPYTYLWSSNHTTSSVSNLIAGTYTVTVTDDNGCTETGSYTVTQPSSLNINFISSTGPSCFNSLDGSISVNASGGVSPYSYQWNDASAQTTSTATGLGDGTYDVTVTDDNGCTETASFTINEPSDLILQVDSVNHASCNGSADGRIIVSASGGTPNYTFQPGSNINNLSAGTYTITVTDANNCQKTTSVTINEPSPLALGLDSMSNVSCNGGNDGFLAITPFGGTSPYTFLWSNNSPLEDQNNIIAGFYQVTVTDANGCTYDTSFNVSEPAALNLTFASTNIPCNSGLSGSATANVTGGVSPYSYLWSRNNETTQTISNLAAGTYSVTITDDNGCITNGSVTISQSTNFTYQDTTSNNRCFGDCDGTIGVFNVAGGNPPYNFTWSANATNTNSFLNNTLASSLCAGNYSLTITDAFNCDTVINYTITENTAITATLSSTNSNCSIPTGTATANPSGGVPPYTYSWLGTGQTSQTAINLSAGTYQVEVTDAVLCRDTFSVVVNNFPDPIVNLSTQPTSCFGSNDGMAIASSPCLTASSCTIEWFLINGTTTNVFNDTLTAGAGTYVSVVTSNGCVARDTITINNAPQISAFVVTNDQSCGTVCDGNAKVFASGGTPPYNYNWGPGTISGQATDSVFNLCSGAYALTITDANGCTINTSFNINQNPSTLNISFTQIIPSCVGGSTGSVTANVSGGISPYNFNWSNSDTSATITNLASGWYHLTVTDANSCSKVDSVEILNAPSFTFNDSIVPVFCNGECTGLIRIHDFTFANSPYTFNWSSNVLPGNEQSSPLESQVFNLCAGNYSVTITDAFGCDSVANFTITEPTAISATLTSTPSHCNIDDGTATVNASGGMPPYSYLWIGTGGQSNQTATGLDAGFYQVIVTDIAFCSDTFSVVVNDDNAPSVSLSSVNTNCATSTDGLAIANSICLQNNSCTIEWLNFNGSTTNVFNDTLVRGAGTYISKVTLNGCVAFDTITINAPSPLTANLNLIDQSCGTICNGSAKAIPSGGVPPYTFNWSPSTVSGQGTDSIFALCKGTYFLTITDDNGCAFTTNFNIDSTSFEVNLTKTDISCNGANDGSISTNIVGGTAPYTYTWSGSLSGSGANPINVSAGTYFLTVTDNLGCSAFDTIDIIEPNPLLSNITYNNASACNICDGNATVTPTGGTPPYTFEWFDDTFNTIGQPTSTANSLCHINYFVVVTDNSGCKDTTFVPLDADNGPNLAFTTTDEDCISSCTGSITVPNPCLNCTYTIYDMNGVVMHIQTTTIPNNPVIFNNVCSNSYIIRVSDNNNFGCSTVDTTIIGSGSGFTLVLSATDASCNGANDGSISTTINGGTPPFIYTWSGSLNGANPTNVSANTYFVTVTDDIGCKVNDTITVGEPSPINASLTTNNTTVCTSCDGSAIASPTGGTPPFTYEWLDDNFVSIGQSKDTAINLCSGTYMAIITDANACADTIVATINSDDGPELIYTTIDESCASACDGSIDITNPCVVCEYELADMNGVIIQTQGPATSISFTNLCSDSYVLKVSDLNTAGCSMSDTLLINSNPSLTISLTATDVSCNGLDDGSINSSITGGTAPYSYSWTNGLSGANPINVGDGNYDVTVTDANGCTNTASITVNEPSAITFSTSTTPASCKANDGTATVIVSGGTGTIQYIWMDNSMTPIIGQTTATATGLGAGLYFVNLIDDNGCEEFLAVLVNNSNGPFATIFFTNETCENSCDGTVSVDADCIDNGTCTIEWRDNNGQIIGTTDSIVGLCAGDYFVTLTDTAGCITNMQSIVTGASPITATLGSTNTACISNPCIGSAFVNASGGIAPYTFEWFDASNNLMGTDDTLSAICVAGIYFVEVTDQNNCTERFSVAVNDDSGENFTLTTTDVSCGGSCDGSATVNVPCLDPVCEVRWFTSTATPLDSFITTINGLCSGDYYVEVTNGSGCKSIDNFSITESDAIETNASIVDATCNSNADGSITVNPTGGIGNYTYNWSPAPTNGQGTNTASGLLAGTYYVTVSDNVCSVLDTFTVNEPLELNATFTTSDASCGLSDGSASATVTGGTTPYTYQWFDAANTILAGETSSTLNNINSGVYRIRVTDNNSCEKFFTVTIDDSDGPTISLDSTVDNTCYGGNSGEIKITVSGPNAPYTYNWLPNGQGSEDIKNLPAGTYTIVATNSLGCVSSETYTINEPTKMLANFTKVDADCGLCNGSASLVVTGGTAPYTYVWSNGSSQTNASNLCAGVYSVKVSDANGCSETFNFNINNSGGITSENISTTATCLSSCTGSASVTPIGGTPPYSYFWIHNGSTQNSLNNMCAGTYFLQITDNNNCTRISEVTISGPSANLNMVENVTPVTCDGSSCNGSIFLNVSGGLPPYIYSWTPGTFGNTNFISGLCQGLYNVTVTDANLCFISKTIAVGNEGDFFDADPVATDVSCFGACDGSLSSKHILTGQYSTQWLDANGNAIAPPNTDIPSGVCAGIYILEVSQLIFGCQTFYQVEVKEPDTVLVLPTITKNIDCFGDCDGSISVSVLGGTLPYTFAWDDPSNQNGSQATNLCTGDYTVTVTDDNSCFTSLTTTLNNPALFTVDITDSTGVNCSSECTGTATSTISGGTPPYTFNWTGGQNVQNPDDLCFGKNILTVTDSKGCMVMDSVLITAQDTVDATANADQTLCEGEEIVLNGTIEGDNITSFGWYEMPSGDFFTQKMDTTFTRTTGDYEFILVATNGNCTDTATVNIHIDPSPLIDAGGTITLYDDDVERISLFGADVSYIYVWTPREGLSDTTIAEPVVSVRETTTYHISVTNVEGCEARDSILVIYYPELRVPTGITPNGDGVNDVWNIDFIDRFPNAEITIFNRWGEELFHSKGYNTPWNGTYKGKTLPVGTYYYIVDLKDDKYETMTGPLTIMR